MKSLFHITTRSTWDRSQSTGEYRPASLASEGFIHLSTEDQWRHTLHRLFHGIDDLIVLSIDPEKLDGDIKLEAADGELFPHLYGPLPTAAVISVRDAPRMLALPEGFRERVMAVDDAIGDVVACAIVDHGRPATYVVLAARPGRPGQIKLGEVIKQAAGISDAGWMQCHSLPRSDDGALDEVALLAYVESLVEQD